MNVETKNLNPGQMVQFSTDGKLLGGRVVYVHHGFFEVESFDGLTVRQYRHCDVESTLDGITGQATVMEVA